uniref:Uncharacterized protein n=1 Tax=Medicago truncatula TaxID=3880 RepID=A2Q2T6_MEDTR|nr:hypothetical protein MtrDRAFT_AC152184g33v2 [Medicago truncatula]
MCFICLLVSACLCVYFRQLLYLFGYASLGLKDKATWEELTSLLLEVNDMAVQAIVASIDTTLLAGKDILLETPICKALVGCL